MEQQTRQVPSYIDPFRYADQGRHIEGRIALAEMARLVPSLSRAGGECQVLLRFRRDAQNLPVVTGHIRAALELVCQRCLEPMQHDVDIAVSLGVVTSEEQAKRLPDEYDPLEVTGDQLYVHDLVEDELILALPVVAVHRPGECSVQTRFGESGGEAPAKPNPFAELGSLKKGRQPD